MNRWRVQKRKGRWRVMDRDCWHDVYDTLPEAHTAATQYAVTTELFKPGGLTELAQLLNAVEPRDPWKDCL